jgi:hypothetical protein
MQGPEESVCTSLQHCTLLCVHDARGPWGVANPLGTQLRYQLKYLIRNCVPGYMQRRRAPPATACTAQRKLEDGSGGGGKKMAELSLLRNDHRTAVEVGATDSSLLCILYCEFDPHKGPRPVFQVPKDYVSAEVCEMLSDHLIASSELCGHLISVAAFGLQFVGHPEYIRDERYERNQFMYNVCFVFDVQTDVSAYRPLICKVAKDFRTIETNHRFLSSHETRGRIEEIICGILNDINQTGKLHMPPTGVEDIPLSSEFVGSDSLHLKQSPLLDKLPEVHPHEVPVWVAPSQDCSKYQHLHPFLPQLLPFFTEDGRTGGSDIATIARRTSLQLAQVINVVALLTQRGLIRLVERVEMSNVYVCTQLLRDLPGDSRLRNQCIEYCRTTGATTAPLFSAAYRILCAVDPSKRLSEVSHPLPHAGSGGGGAAAARGHDADAANIDVIRLIRFARVHRLIRRIHHLPLWVGPDGGGAGGAGGGGSRRADLCLSSSALPRAGATRTAAKKDRNTANRELSAKILALCKCVCVCVCVCVCAACLCVSCVCVRGARVVVCARVPASVESKASHGRIWARRRRQWAALLRRDRVCAGANG